MKAFLRFIATTVLIGRILCLPVQAQPTPPPNVSLTVNKTTGAIVGPVDADTFKTANGIGGGGGSGTVTSVGMTVPTFLSIAGSPITTSGTLAVTLSGTALPASSGGTGLTALSSNVVSFLGAADYAAMRTQMGLGTGDSPTFTAATLSGGTLTGGASGLTFAAGGTNQNITLTPSGSGQVVIPGGGIAVTGIAEVTAVRSGFYIQTNTQFLFGTGGSGDAALQRASAGVVEINNGTAGTLRDLSLRAISGTGLFLTPASTTTSAGLRLPHGAAPTSPTNGDVWTTTAGMYVQVNGSTVGPLSSGGGSGNVTTTGATANVVMVGGGSTAIVPLASIGTAGHPLVSAGAGAPPAFGVVSLTGGGTGITSTTKGNIILGNNSTTYGQLGVGADNRVLTANSSATLGVSWEVAGSGSGNVIAVSSLTANAIPVGNGTVGLTPSAVTYNSSNSTLTVGSAGAGNIIANVVTLQNLTVTDLNATNLTLTNPVPVAAGGTNLTTITANYLVSGNGTGNPILIAPGSSGNILTSNGTAFSSAALTAVGGVTIAGGTNSFSLTNGTTTANISGGFVGNIIVSGNVSTTLPEIGAKVGFRGIPWVVANANATTDATSNGKGWIGDVIANNTTTFTINRTQAATDAANGGWAWSVFHATAGGNVVTITASSGNIILAGSGNLTGGTSAVISAGGMATFTLANSTLIVAGSNVTVP